MDIWAFSVGQADCLLLSYEGTNILIDAGEKDDGEEILKSLTDCNVEAIDLLILTHFDKDHIGAVPDIVASIPVKNVWMPDYVRDSKLYKKMIEALDSGSVPYERVSSDKTVELGTAKLELWASPIEYTGADNDDNEQSLVLAVNYGECRLLFMGDANGSWLSKLCYGTYNLTCDLVKIPYHGKWEANMTSFIAFSLPEQAIITDSKKNPSDQSTIDALNAIGAEIHQTMYGPIHLQCNGRKVAIPES